MRRLATIVDDLDRALKREVKNVIDIGGLLVEAKKQVKHGDWYGWLNQNFALSVASASWYMRLFDKTKSLDSSDLKIRADLLYALFVDDKFAKPVKRQILREAKKKWVNMARAEQLQREHDQSDGKPPRDWLIDWEEAQRLASECRERLIRVKKAAPDHCQELNSGMPELEDDLLQSLDVVRSFNVVPLAEPRNDPA